MTGHQPVRRFPGLTTPRSAAVAGIVFAVLFTISLLLLRSALPERGTTASAWVGPDSGRISVALIMEPFAGIAFLWFIGVIRDRIGEYEDRFFSTVMIGSGLLFLATVFASMGVAGAVLSFSRHGTEPSDEIVYFGREVMLHMNSVYAVRMAGVFMISLGTIWRRTGLMPRWLVLTTYATALFLLLVVSFSVYVALLFPMWVLLISVFIMVRDRRGAGGVGEPGPA